MGRGGGGWAGLEGVVGDGVVVPWEIDPWVSSVDQCGGLQGAREHEHEGAGHVGMLVKVWKCC